MAPKKAEGTTTSKPKSTHASYQLKERNGSSRQQLKKYVKANNQLSVTDNMFDSLFNKALRAGVEKGVFEQPKGASGGTKLSKNYKNANKTAAKKEGDKAAAPKKAAAKKDDAKKPAAPKKTATKKEAGEKKPAPKKAAATAPKKAAAPKKTAAKKEAPAADKTATTTTKTKTGRVSKTTKAPAAKKATTTKKAAAPKKTAKKEDKKEAAAA
ncbi:hypothetical protein DL765_007128 [Monosporascus sp. GIB2]|nr:hypothetical protein DL765_007128 [Monosporascus sp. GIB2]